MKFMDQCHSTTTPSASRGHAASLGAKVRTSPPRVAARPLSGPFDFVIAPVFEHELKKIRQELNLLLLVQPLVGCERRGRANTRWRLDRSVRVRVS